MPEMTYSCHYIRDEGFRVAIQDFLHRETDQVLHLSSIRYLHRMNDEFLFQFDWLLAGQTRDSNAA